AFEGGEDDAAHSLLRFEVSGEEAGAIALALPELPEEAPEEEPGNPGRLPERRRFELSLGADGDGWLLDRRTQQLARIDFGADRTVFEALPADAAPAYAILRAEPDSYWTVTLD